MNSPPDLPIVLGHRGARHAAVENTMAAFELAQHEGALGTELDVQLSADGQLFVVHDLDLRRVTDGRDARIVRRMQSQELAKVRLTGDHPIPRLAQVLEWAVDNGQFVNIELKSGSARRDPVAQATAQLLIDRSIPTTSVIVSSFHPWLLKRFRDAAPQYSTGFLFSAQHGCLTATTWPRLLGCQAVHPPATLLLDRPELMQRFEGYFVNTWTVNDPGQARALKRLGVHTIISDCPGAVLEALRTP